MIQFLLIVLVAVTIGCYLWYRYRRSKKEKRRKLAETWGQPKARDHNWGQIKYYFERFKNSDHRRFIDDATWNDLNFDEIFALLDRTESNIGQQILYDMLRHPSHEGNILTERAQWITLFSQQKELRLDIQLQLQKLTGFSVWKLSNLLFEELPRVPRWFYLLLASPILSIVFIVLGIFVTPAFFLALALLFVFNFAVRYVTGKYISRYTAGLTALSEFLNVCKRIGASDLAYNHALGPMGKQFRQTFAEVKSLRKRVGKVLKKPNPNDLSSIFIEYVNTTFLLKLIMFTLSVRSIEKHQQNLQKLYYKVGYIDAMISGASFKNSLHRCCEPVFTPSKKVLHYEKIVHPLLDEPVPNSAEVGRKGVLVTGSNMSGKTTFLKTLGVNQILAQTFNLCCADSAKIPFCHVVSSMRREDDITEGKSFYLGEVERVKTLVDIAGKHDGRTLFLLDEIFRGTNTIERIAASREVLKWLNGDDSFVLASTHDLELVDMLRDDYEFNHFADEVRDGALIFDYKLKPGHSSTKNAIKLLGINHYPQEIVEQALKTSQKLEKEGVINYQKAQS